MLPATGRRVCVFAPPTAATGRESARTCLARSLSVTKVWGHPSTAAFIPHDRENREPVGRWVGPIYYL